MYSPTLVVASLDHPDQSGWSLAGKLCFIDPDIRVWLYQACTERADGNMARLFRVDELLEYGGDLLGLSDAIIDLLTDQPDDSPCRIHAVSQFEAVCPS